MISPFLSLYISKVPSNFNIPVPCPGPDASLGNHCTKRCLQSDPKRCCGDYNDRTQVSSPVPGDRGSRAGGPRCQLQEMVRGMPRPLEPLGCLCSMEQLRPRKEEACGFLWAGLPPLPRARCPAPERLYMPFTPSFLSPFLPPIIHSTVGCPLWARHYTGLGRGGVPACHLFLLLPQAYSGGRQPLCPQLNLSKHGLGGRDDGSCECHKPEAPDRTIIAKTASSEAVDLSVQGQVLPLA